MIPTQIQTVLRTNISSCGTLEHFCIHVSNESKSTTRSCLHISHAGDGRVDCLGASDERRSFCNYAHSSLVQGRTGAKRHALSPRSPRPTVMSSPFLCAETKDKCMHMNDICNGHVDCPIGDDEKLCGWLPPQSDKTLFYCRNGSRLSRRSQCNNRIECSEGEDEWLCDLVAPRPRIGREFDPLVFPLYPSNLSSLINQLAHSAEERLLTPSFSSSDRYCNRGFPIYDSQYRRCLCSPSYWGERCENQRERVSVVFQVDSPASVQRDFVVKFIFYLLDVDSLEILAEDEVLHVPYFHSAYKHLLSLTFNGRCNLTIRIDAFELNMQQVVAYLTSWKFTLDFSFLPVIRLVIKLHLPNIENNELRTRPSCNLCEHGQSLAFQNSDDVFCLYDNNWADANCNTSFLCAKDARTLSSRRCLCPTTRHGRRCFVPNIVNCHCLNGGTCMLLDARVGQSVCLCSDTFFGERCEHQHASITVSMFDKDQIQSMPAILIHFVDVDTYQTANFKNTFLFERLSTGRPLVVNHVGNRFLPMMAFAKVFDSIIVHDYAYYLLLDMPSKETSRESYPKHLWTQLEESRRCSHVRDMHVFKSPINILSYEYSKRIKYYLRACYENTTNCFHDENYMCFCPHSKDVRGNCILYDHAREQCHEPNYCLNGGMCIENRRDGIVDFACLCLGCHYYGALCQFSMAGHRLSFDVLVGTDIRTGKNLLDQPTLIKACIIVLVSLIALGIFGNITSILTFAQIESRENGCGWYLLVVSIVNQLALVLLGLRFMYLLATRMTVLRNRVQSLIICQSLEFGLTLFTILSDWLWVCVSVERTWTVTRGASFNKTLSVRTAKRVCIILPLILAAATVHEPFTHRLIEDPRLGRFTWCVRTFKSRKMESFALIFTFVNQIAPFILNGAATSVLLFIVTRQKLSIKKQVTLACGLAQLFLVPILFWDPQWITHK